jgi:plasmid stabilization system protein ParE
LQAVRDYLARSSPGYAQALAARVVARAEALADQPLSGAEVEEYGDPDIREVFEHPYRIIYRVAGADVQVVAVIHSSRQLPRIPPS